MHILCREVKELWVWYIWLVLPFWHTIQRESGDSLWRDDDGYLFPRTKGAGTLNTS